jgi:uncharacterized protein YjbI with pentapeptide repeats
MRDRLRPPADRARLDLRADCERCFALCCVAPAFSASADFAIDKPAGHPCPNLRPDFRCAVHASLRQKGFPGCVAYDCFGAGQKVAQVTLRGEDWRRAPRSAERAFAAFAVMRQLHELLWYLTEARTLRATRDLHGELDAAIDGIERLTRGSADALGKLDVTTHRGGASALLLRASEIARARAPGRAIDHRGADLAGADLRGADLRGASLRGACLIGSDLGGADLRLADVIGADLRGADLRGADLRGSLFLIPSQLESARGDARTKLPATRARPAHWTP